jgi:hypothetical protein
MVAHNSPMAGTGAILFDTGMAYRVDPDLLLSISYADSSMGKSLKTSFNPMNVGNDDRGNVIIFNSWAEGIGACGKVLNNQYLGNKETIGSLSYAGGGRGYVYATGFNWNRNVLDAMTQLKGQPISGDYKFRL